MKTAADFAQEAPRNAHFHIAPRFTCGSPAMVSCAQVCHVADEEREARENHLSGVYGNERKSRAEKLGLSWIAYARWEKGKKVFRLDLLTGETIVEPPAIDWHKEREQLLNLRNRKQYVGLNHESEQELAALEFRALIHRQEIK